MAKFDRKTILALAIAAASTQAGAATIDVSGPTQIKMGPSSYADGVTLTGSANRGTDHDGIDFDAVQVTGDFVNTANYNLNGQYVDAIGIDDGTGPNAITGSFQNHGNISANGYNASGINIANTNIGDGVHGNDAVGNVVNTGNIQVTDQSGVKPTEEVAGLLLEQVHMSGDVINKGTISVIGENGVAIKANGESVGAPTGMKFGSIGRDVVNDGTLSAVGKNAMGINLKMIQFGTDIENNGTIRVSGEDSRGIKVDRTDYNRIINTGTIQAAGVGSVGIEVRESFGNTVLNSETGVNANGQLGQYLMKNGIVNEGTITAQGVGIKITNDLLQTGPGETSHVDNFYRITQNKGVISGGESAIDGNGQADLYLNGGSIIGNIEGIRQAFINGQVAISSKLIEADNLNVVSGNLYVAEVKTTVTGDMRVNSGAGVSMFVSDATDPSTPFINVKGSLTLENGSKVSVLTSKGAFTQQGTKYVLVSADQLHDLGVSVVSATPLLKITNYGVENNQLSATIGLAAGNDVAGSLSGMGADRNTQRAASAFVDGVLSKLSPDHPLYQAFMNAQGSDLARLAKQLNPETNGGTQAAAMSATGLTNSSVADRAASVGANSGDLLAQTGAWVKVLNGDSNQNERGGISGYDADSSGIIIGADGKLNEQTTLGLAFSHVHTDVNGDNGNDTDVDTNLLTGYAGWENGPVTVLGSLSYGKSENDSKRHIASETAKASYDANMLAADLSAGYTFNLNENLAVQPIIGTRYTKVDIDGFTEKGSAAALSTGSQKLEVFDVGGGVKLKGTYGNFKPTARLMAYRDLAQDSAQTNSAFTLGGNTFVTSGVEATKWTYETGVGLEWTHGQYTLGAAYDYTRKADFHADTLSLKARIDF
ncbi:autotransporter domain-containing protein [Pseudomonas carnis]|uniref:autotransporter family protein n=1 Tax=Pseudomonas carnis TaxID=2487355 RepID=UPI0018E8DA21|nr:autotransporter domain-containing protein [Pseudomonas carnis]